MLEVLINPADQLMHCLLLEPASKATQHITCHPLQSSDHSKLWSNITHLPNSSTQIIGNRLSQENKMVISCINVISQDQAWDGKCINTSGQWLHNCMDHKSRHEKMIERWRMSYGKTENDFRQSWPNQDTWHLHWRNEKNHGKPRSEFIASQWGFKSPTCSVNRTITDLIEVSWFKRRLKRKK